VSAGKNFIFTNMETQDASAAFLIKFWPWFEANRKRLIYIAGGVFVVLFVWYFITTQQAQKAVDAGQAYTKMQLNLPPNPTAPQLADAYLKLADQYAGTLAAERAQLQSAAVLFSAGRYEDAQAKFQKFLGANIGSSLAASAKLGVAASLEAQNKLDLAATEYRAVTTSYPNSAEALPAKFSLGRVLEAQGKLSEAGSYYQEVTRSPLAGSLASEAAQRAAQIQGKLAATKPAGKS
jgi:predicted negative regulator of RcsB-dependent stress response